MLGVRRRCHHRRRVRCRRSCWRRKCHGASRHAGLLCVPDSGGRSTESWLRSHARRVRLHAWLRLVLSRPRHRQLNRSRPSLCLGLGRLVCFGLSLGLGLGLCPSCSLCRSSPACLSLRLRLYLRLRPPLQPPLRPRLRSDQALRMLLGPAAQLQRPGGARRPARPVRPVRPVRPRHGGLFRPPWPPCEPSYARTPTDRQS